MKCTDIQYLISAYVDNELTADEISSVEKHIKECENCMNFYKDLKKVRQIMLSEGKLQASANFTDNVMDKINSNIKPSGTKHNNVYTFITKKYLAVAAAFLFVVFGSVFYVANKQHTADFLVDSGAIFEIYDDFVESEVYDSDVVSFLLV